MGWFDNSFLNPLNDANQIGNFLGFSGSPTNQPGAIQQAIGTNNNPTPPTPPAPQSIQVQQDQQQLTYEDQLKTFSTLFTGGQGVLTQTPTAGHVLLGS